VKTSTGVPSPVTTIPNADIINFKSYPAERTFGTIYEKSSWKDLKRFCDSGEVNLALNGDKVDFSSTDIDYTNRIRFIPWWSTGTNQWKVTVQYKVTVAGGTWCGPDIKSQVNHDGANFDVMGFKSFGTGTSSFIYDGTGTTQYSTAAAPASSIGDLMEVTFRRDDSTIIYTIKNAPHHLQPPRTPIAILPINHCRCLTLGNGAGWFQVHPAPDNFNISKLKY
jgi:hypothetical protein